MTTLYKINGEFMTQSEAREHGYTLSPTITINYKSSESATFGQSAGSGLLQGSLDNMINGAFYAGVYEWYGIDNLARAAKKYPATAETVEMKKISDSSISAGAKLLSNDVNYYLIANDLTLGWVAEDDLETNGWRDNSQPVTTLPTVTTSGDFGNNNRTSVTDGYVNLRASKKLKYSSNYIQYDDNVTYACVKYTQSTTFAGRVRFVIWKDSDGEISAANTGAGIGTTTGTSTSVTYIYLAVCHSPNVTIVVVLDSSNNKYNAFKFNLNGVDYYYVLDEVQTDWVTDITTIGYHFIGLPTVDTMGTAPYTVSGSTTESNKTLNPGAISRTLKWKTGGFTINPGAYHNMPIAIQKATSDNSGTLIPTTSLSLVYDNTDGGTTTTSLYYLSVKNVTMESVTVRQVYLYRCRNESDGATTVYVYDLSDNVFNAFKFNLNGTDYYYVLDGTQADWTSDLSSIGYKSKPTLPTVTKAYGTLGQSIGAGNGFSTGETYSSSYVHALISLDTHGEEPQESDKTYFGWSCSDNNSEVYATNNTSGSVYVSNWTLYRCDETHATLIEVKNDSNTGVVAYMISVNGTNYYYVCDNVQTDWTDDLSSIGYHLSQSFSFNVKFGEQVSIPFGYSVNTIKSTSIFLRSSEIEIIENGDQYNGPFRISFSGANDYCDDTDTALIGCGIDPCITVFAVTSQYNTGYWISYASATTPSVAPSRLNNVEINSNDNFLKFDFKFTGGAINGPNVTIYNAVGNGKAFRVRKYISGYYQSNYFTIQSTIWQLLNGEFSWLPDTSSTTGGLCYYYYKNNLWVRIYCEKEQ